MPVYKNERGAKEDRDAAICFDIISKRKRCLSRRF